MTKLTYADAPPQDIEAERAVIGACLQDVQSVAEAFATVRPEHFFDEFHRAIMAAIATLWQRGEGIDPFTVVHQLAGQEFNEAPSAYLSGCIGSTYAFGSAVRFYAEAVRSAADRRRLIDSAINIANDAWAPGSNPLEVTDRAIETLLLGGVDRQRSTSAGIGDVLDSGLWGELLEELSDPTLIRGIRSGWDMLDRALGGFQDAGVYTILADTSVGKSWLVAWLAWTVAANGHRPLIVTTEMSRKEVTRRLTYMQAGIDFEQVRKNPHGASSEVFERVNEAAQTLKDANRITICDVGKIGLDTLVSEVRRQRTMRGCDIIFIDHIQHIRVRGIRPGDTVARIEEVTASTKGIAMNEDIPVVQVSHIARAAAQLGRPGVHGGKGGGSIEQDSNVQIEMVRVYFDQVERAFQPFLTDDDANAYAKKHNKIPIEIRVNKNRGGGKPSDVRYLDWSQGGRFMPVIFGDYQ